MWQNFRRLDVCFTLIITQLKHFPLELHWQEGVLNNVCDALAGTFASVFSFDYYLLFNRVIFQLMCHRKRTTWFQLILRESLVSWFCFSNYLIYEANIASLAYQTCASVYIAIWPGYQMELQWGPVKRPYIPLLKNHSMSLRGMSSLVRDCVTRAPPWVQEKKYSKVRNLKTGQIGRLAVVSLIYRRILWRVLVCASGRMWSYTLQSAPSSAPQHGPTISTKMYQLHWLISNGPLATFWRIPPRSTPPNPGTPWQRHSLNVYGVLPTLLLVIGRILR